MKALREVKMEVTEKNRINDMLEDARSQIACVHQTIREIEVFLDEYWETETGEKESDCFPKKFEVGDRLTVPMPDRKYMATAIETDDKWTLFLLDECLDDAMPMNENGGTEGGYEQSDLRRYLNRIGDNFPNWFQERLMPDKNGDYLYLLTMMEVFGYDKDFNGIGGQIEWMRDREHRKVKRKGKLQWYWLRDPVSAMEFAYVSIDSLVYCDCATDSLGIRPAFKIKNAEIEQRE